MKIPMVFFVGLLALGPPPAVIAQDDVTPDSGANGAIELFCVLPDGSVDRGCCDATTLVYPDRYVVVPVAIQVRLAGATAGGISGAEFYLDGAEAISNDWTFLIPRSYSDHRTGNIFCPSDPEGDGVADVRRGFFAWDIEHVDDCQRGDGEFVRLARLQIWDVTPPIVDLPPTTLRVVGASPSSRPGFACPLVTLCDAPVFTAVCVDGGTFVINREIPAPMNPSPADAARNQPNLGLELGWENPVDSSCAPDVVSQDIYLGTDTDPSLVQSGVTSSTFRAPPLLPLTTYFWRVSREAQSGEHVASPLWSFTTGEPVAVTLFTWSGVKALYR